MPQVVQARCPHCKNMLRIPAEWMSQPMKCKHCQQVFQAKPRAAAAPAGIRAGTPQAGKGAPVGVTAKTPLPPAAPVDAGALAFDEPGPAGFTRLPARRRGKGGWWKGAV